MKWEAKVMRVNTLSQNALGLNIMTHDEFEEIHFASLEVLERVGVKVHEEEALELLKNAGAQVNGNLVRIPAWMIQDALASAPCRVAVSNRNKERTMFLEKGRSYFGTGSDTLYTIDIESGERRSAVKQDVINAARLGDYLPNIDFIMSSALASDVPNEDSYVHQFEAMALNSTKPIVYTAADRRDLIDIVKIAEAIAGGPEELAANPFLVLYNEPSSPLQHSKEAVQKMLYLAEKRLPMVYIPAVMMGGTGPVTPAGSIVVANCESLSGLVIHQLKSRGAPFIYGAGVPPLDMRTSLCSYAAPEEHLNCSTIAQMSQSYNLPVFVTAGCSDSQIFDQQAGMEAGFNLLASTLAGGNLIHDLGYIGAGMTFSNEMLVLCDETIGMCKRFVRGNEINAETLAVDIIEQVGPGGNYFSEAHTFNNFKQHIWYPGILNRKEYDGWAAEGKSFEQKANQKVKEILNTHVPEELPEDVVKEVKEISLNRDQS